MAFHARATRLGAYHLMNAIGLRNVVETVALTRRAAGGRASRLRRDPLRHPHRRIGDRPQSEHRNRRNKEHDDHENDLLRHGNTLLRHRKSAKSSECKAPSREFKLVFARLANGRTRTRLAQRRFAAQPAPVRKRASASIGFIATPRARQDEGADTSDRGTA